MATYVPAKKNAAYITYVGLVSNISGNILQVNPTLATGDVKVAIDDGAPANLATLPVVDGDFTKRVKVSLSAAEMNGDNITIIFSDVAGAEWCDLILNIQTTANQIDDLGTVLDAISTAVVTTIPETITTLQSTADDIPNTSEFEARTIVSDDYTVVSDLGTVQSGDSFAIVNGEHGLVSIQDDVDEILTDTGSTLDTLIKDIPTTEEFALRTLPASEYTIVTDLGIVQSGDSYAIVNGDHGLVSIQDDVDEILTDTGITIPAQIVGANPILHTADGETTIGNTTTDAGDSTDTFTNDNANYYQTGPGVAVNGFGLNTILTFSIGLGRIPSTVTVDGHFDSGAQRTVQVWARNYETGLYDQLSNSTTDFFNLGSDTLQLYAMHANMVDFANGFVRIRFTSTSEVITDVWSVDYCIVNSVAAASCGLTANAIQAAVWARSNSGHDNETLGHNLSSTLTTAQFLALK